MAPIDTHDGGMRTTKPASSLGLGRLARAFSLDDPPSMGFLFTNGDHMRKNSVKQKTSALLAWSGRESSGEGEILGVLFVYHIQSS